MFHRLAILKKLDEKAYGFLVIGCHINGALLGIVIVLMILFLIIL